MCQHPSALPACRRPIRKARTLLAAIPLAIAIVGCAHAAQASTVAAPPMPLFPTSASAKGPYCPATFKRDPVLGGASAVFTKVTGSGIVRMAHGTHAGIEAPSRVRPSSLWDRWLWCARGILRSMVRGA